MGFVSFGSPLLRDLSIFNYYYLTFCYPSHMLLCRERHCQNCRNPRQRSDAVAASHALISWPRTAGGPLSPLLSQAGQRLLAPPERRTWWRRIKG
jgi:hypothetical protein